MSKIDNRLYRGAMLTIIADTLFESGVEKLFFEPASFARNQDRIHFNCDGHKCILLSLEKPNLENGTMIMTVEAKGKELKDWSVIRLNFNCNHFRCSTLERIANDVYDWLKDSDWDEWNTFLKESLLNFFDTYDKMTHDGKGI